MSLNSPTSARDVERLREKEQHEEFLRQQDRNFDNSTALETIRLQRIQIEKTEQMLEDTKKTNKRMLFWTIVCAVAGILSALVAIIVAIVK